MWNSITAHKLFLLTVCTFSALCICACDVLGKYIWQWQWRNSLNYFPFFLLKLFKVKTKDVERVCLCKTQNVRLDFLSPCARPLIYTEHETRMETKKKKIKKKSSKWAVVGSKRFYCRVRPLALARWLPWHRYSCAINYFLDVKSSGRVWVITSHKCFEKTPVIVRVLLVCKVG